MIKKNILIAAATIGTASLLALSAFAQTGGTPTNTPPVNTPPAPTAISCVASTVNTREQALVSGMTALTQSLNSAYSARATALQQAYALTGGNGAIRTAVKAAWSAFNSSSKDARKAWQSARNSAWSAFRASVKACKAPASVSDSANSANEHSGQ